MTRRIEVTRRFRSLIALLSCVLILAAQADRHVAAQDLDRLREDAADGEPAALFELGDLHEHGEGVPRDLERAADYMRLAAERGHAEAQYRLGLYLAAGLGGETDLEVGYTWLALAADGDAAIALVAAALRDEVAERLDETALSAARERVAAFEPSSGPATLPDEAVAEAPVAPEVLAERLPSGGCGPVRVALDDEPITVSGHLVADVSLDAWRSEALDVLPDRDVAFDLSGLDASLCRVIERLADEPTTLADGPGLLLRNAAGDEKQVFEEGDELVMEIGPLAAERYVFVDYFIHDGEVLHMHPAAGETNDPVPEDERLVLGDAEGGGRVWEIGPPFGSDLVVVFTSERPLYGGEREVVEPTAGYLEFLEGRLASPLPEDTIRATYRVVTTESR